MEESRLPAGESAEEGLRVVWRIVFFLLLLPGALALSIKWLVSI